MPLELTSLSSLDAAAVADKQSQQSTMIQEQNPALELRRGVIHDILLYFGAQLAQLTQTNIDRLNSSSSLLKISQDPTLADEDIVDAALSNYNLTRQTGTLATGQITIVVNTDTTVTIGRGAIFEADGKQFTSDNAYTAKSDAENVVLPTDRLLSPLNDGTFAFNIEVTAADEGPEYRLEKDTLLEPLTRPLTFVKSFATEDFLGGAAPETNQQLLARQQEGIAAKALSNSINMNASLRANPDFEDYVSASVVGYGDAEMLRDARSIMPISFGGRIDWYVRTEEQIRRFNLVKTATLIEKTSDGFGIWQFSIGRDEVPGFYEVAAVTPSNAVDVLGGYQITADIRGLDTTAIPGLFVPDVANFSEAAYSRFQTGTIRFKDSATSTTSLTVNSSTADYKVEVWGLLNVAEIQAYAGGRGVRNAAGDVLIKAPVPCFLQISLTIYKQSGDATPDLPSIRSDIAGMVNRLPFGSRLAASRILDIVHTYLSSSMIVGAVDLFGRIRRPDGSMKYLRDPFMLIVPDEPAKMVTERTVQFFVSPSDISIGVEVLPTLEV